MTQPTVFISSTYVDLKDIRLSLKSFIEERYGFRATLFERGGIPFDYSQEPERSCYDEVRTSDLYILIIGGRYGSPARYGTPGSPIEDDDLRQKMHRFNSITRVEYETANAANIPTHVFVDLRVMLAYEFWKENGRNPDLKISIVDSNNIFELIERVLEAGTFFQKFASESDISDWLRNQWAGIFGRHLRTQKEKLRRISRSDRRINCYKLFYHRNSANISIGRLSQDTGIPFDRLGSFETPHPTFKYDEKHFPTCSEDDVDALSSALHVADNELYAGAPDDFCCQFTDYYYRYHNKERKNAVATTMPLWPSKVVILDFDGTMTLPDSHLTTWERLWVLLGYNINECAKHHQRYRMGDIKHPEWCRITLDAFKKRTLTKDMVLGVGDTMKLVDGVQEAVTFLSRQGIPVYVLSGSIDIIVKRAIACFEDAIADIEANRFTFDASGAISDIIGTEYDFQGKAEFIKKVIRRHDVSPHEVMFVGNSGNDEWAYISGAHTLCVNPQFTDPYDQKKWTYALRAMSDFREILPYVLPGVHNRGGNGLVRE